jgi:hypothetical protein
VDHVRRQFGEPHFCFPRDLTQEAFEYDEVQECCNINPTSFAVLEKIFEFHLPLGRDGTVRSDSFDEKNLIPVFVKEDNVRQLSMI